MTDRAPHAASREVTEGPFGIFFRRHGPAYRWWVTATVMLGALACVLTGTIVNVALPDMMGAFGMGQDRAQLLAAGFLAAMAGTMLLCAWAVQAYGYRATFIAALALFVFASAMGGFATSEAVLVLARVLQGAAAGILQPLSMLVVVQVFPAHRRGSALGIYGLGLVLAPVLGPVLGGVLTDQLNWRYVFLASVPPCAVSLVLGMFLLPGRIGRGRRPRFDWVGFALMITSLVALLGALSSGQRLEWASHEVSGAFALALACGLAFVAWELHVAEPMLDLRVFAYPAFVAGAVVSTLFGAAVFASNYLVPLFVQIVQGYTPTRAGLLLMPSGLFLAAVFPLAGRLADRTRPRVTVCAGLLIFAIATLPMAFADAQSGFWTVALWFAVGRIGLGLMTPGLTAGALHAVPVLLLAQASGVVNFVRQLGGALGVNLGAVYLEHRVADHVHGFTAAQLPGAGATTVFLREVSSLYAAAGVPGAAADHAALHHLGQVLMAQGTMMAYRDAFLLLAVVAMLAALPAWLMRDRGPAGAASALPKAIPDPVA